MKAHKIGDLVKVRCEGEVTWSEMKFLGVNTTMDRDELTPRYIVEGEKGRITVPRENVLARGEMLPGELEEYASLHAKSLFEMLVPNLNFLVPLAATPLPQLDEEESVITLMGGYLTIQPAHVNVATIVGDKEFPGWSVSIWKTVHNYPHSPDDIDQCDMGVVRGEHNAVMLALKTAFNIVMEGHFDSQVIYDFEDDIPL